jgi:aarF domain-containing kinase
MRTTAQRLHTSTSASSRMTSSGSAKLFGPRSPWRLNDLTFKPYTSITHCEAFYPQQKLASEDRVVISAEYLPATNKRVVKPALTEVQQKNLLQRLWHWILRRLQGARESAVLTARMLEIAIRLSPLTLLTPLAMLVDYIKNPNNKYVNDRAERNKNAVSDFAWEYFMKSMQALGPCFVKLCQWVATRRDIFPPQVCDRLAALHDRGYAHSWSHTDRVLRENFGDYQAKGLTLEKTALGCGSAAQVYRGMLKVTDPQTGQVTDKPVAVKILHPRFEKLVRRDLWLLTSVADSLHSLPIKRVQLLNLPNAAYNFGVILQRQADLSLEAANLETFRHNFEKARKKKHGQTQVSFPQPMPGWSGPEVLVEELIQDAKPIAEFLKDDSKEGQQVRKELAAPLLRAFLKMVFTDNFVHADLHPGNVLIQTTTVKSQPSSWFPFFNTTSTEPEKTREQHTIVFLDAGIASSLSHNDLLNLLDLFRAVLTNSGEHAGRLMVERAKNKRDHTPEEVDAFSRGIGALVSEFHDNRKAGGLSLGAVRIGSLLSRVLDLCRVYSVEIDPAMASIVISTLILEGLGRSLEPDLNLMEFALPFVLNRGGV